MNDRSPPAGAAPLLQDIFNADRVRRIAGEIAILTDAFDRSRFLALALDGLAVLSLMQRVRHLAKSLHAALRLDYPSALRVCEDLAPRIDHKLMTLILPEFVALYGGDHFDASMAALRNLTRYGSSEFGVRPFLDHAPDRVLAVMTGWAADPDEHVRRLASEGSRPRLPWAARVGALVKDPSLAFPILEMLKRDDSPYVRKSVANHINDIGKDHPGWLLERLASWPRDDARTGWILRHGLRSLIKKGDRRALALVGVDGPADVHVESFRVAPAAIRLGEDIGLSIGLRSVSDRSQRLVIDYAVHYVKKNGSRSRKIFKLRTVTIAPGANLSINHKQPIRDFSTRAHHAGTHDVELMINGESRGTASFDLHI